MTLSQWRALPVVDRWLALALTLHEDGIDPSHGQRKALAMDPDLADEWTAAAPPVRDFAALKMATLADEKKDADHPETFRYILGLHEGWEERKAAKVAARLAGNDAPEAAMPTGEFAEILAAAQQASTDETEA